MRQVPDRVAPFASVRVHPAAAAFPLHASSGAWVGVQSSTPDVEVSVSAVASALDCVELESGAQAMHAAIAAVAAVAGPEK